MLIKLNKLFLLLFIVLALFTNSCRNDTNGPFFDNNGNTTGDAAQVNASLPVLY